MAKKLHIVCVSGTKEKLQMASMIASVAAATGDEVSVFFSMNAVKYFIKGNTDEAPVEGEFGNAARQGRTAVPPVVPACGGTG
jgi:peroxiredoxin family protein